MGSGFWAYKDVYFQGNLTARYAVRQFISFYLVFLS